jgi:hypothetical protein
LVIYLAYQQNQSKRLNIQPNNAEIQDLKQQVQHYQNLYQKRVAKDVSESISQNEYDKLAQKHEDYKTLTEQLEVN